MTTTNSESLQSLFEEAGSKWWENTASSSGPPQRGQLVHVFVPYFDQVPLTLVPEDRDDPTMHKTFRARIAPLDVNTPARRSQLPIAAMPIFDKEVRAIYRAKRRPALVLGSSWPGIPDKLRQGTPKWQTAPTVLVAPYYGGDHDGKRGGWPDALMERIQKCEYPQFMADTLPIGGTSVSILRFDQMQPVGSHALGIAPTEHRLSADARGLLDDWIHWVMTGSLSESSVLHDIRTTLMKPLKPEGT